MVSLYEPRTRTVKGEESESALFPDTACGYSHTNGTSIAPSLMSCANSVVRSPTSVSGKSSVSLTR